MASPEVVERVLKAIAAMFGKHPLWVQDSVKMWALQLEDVEDRDLILGTKDLLRKAKSLPTVAQMRDVIEANPKTKVGQPVTIPGCQACRNTGMREMARWWIDDNQKIKVFTGVAACDCAKGIKLQIGPFEHFQDVKDAWERNPATTRVFVASKSNPVLSDEQTMTPEQRHLRLERRKKQNSNGRFTHDVQNNPS